MCPGCGHVAPGHGLAGRAKAGESRLGGMPGIQPTQPIQIDCVSSYWSNMDEYGLMRLTLHTIAAFTTKQGRAPCFPEFGCSILQAIVVTPELCQGKRKRGRFQVKNSTIPLDLGPETRQVKHIKPRFQAVGKILYLGFPRFIPWSLQEPILESWAAAEGFEIWALNEDSLKPGLLKEGPEAFMKDLSSVVQALLPELGPKFVLVDSSFGPGTFLAWELRPFLTGL